MEKLSFRSVVNPNTAAFLAALTLAGCGSDKPEINGYPTQGVVVEKRMEKQQYMITIAACKKNTNGELKLANQGYLKKAAEEIKQGYMGGIIEDKNITNAGDSFANPVNDHPVYDEDYAKIDSHGGNSTCAGENTVNIHEYEAAVLGDYLE